MSSGSAVLRDGFDPRRNSLEETVVTAFRLAHATGEWQEATERCASGLGGGAGPGHLGFLYVTDLLVEHLPDILERLKAHTGCTRWVGATGIGVCATGREYLDEPAIVAMIGEFGPDAFTIFSGVKTEQDAKSLALKCGTAAANLAVVHADASNGSLPELVARLAGRVESGFLVGGLTSSRRGNLQVADTVIEGGISGVAFADSVAVATRLTQGCTPIGPRHEITACQRNVIVTLDGEPALDVFKRDIGEEQARDLNRIGGTVFAGLPIKGSDTGDYLVRNLVGIDPTNKLVAIGEIVKTGSSVMFCRRDRNTAREDMARMLESIGQGLYARPRGGVYYSCLGRGAGLFGAESAELSMIREALGDVPVAGFFCNGEISHNRLYGYTGVLTLFI